MCSSWPSRALPLRCSRKLPGPPSATSRPFLSQLITHTRTTKEARKQARRIQILTLHCAPQNLTGRILHQLLNCASSLLSVAMLKQLLYDVVSIRMSRPDKREREGDNKNKPTVPLEPGHGHRYVSSFVHFCLLFLGKPRLVSWLTYDISLPIRNSCVRRCRISLGFLPFRTRVLHTRRFSSNKSRNVPLSLPPPHPICFVGSIIRATTRNVITAPHGWVRAEICENRNMQKNMKTCGHLKIGMQISSKLFAHFLSKHKSATCCDSCNN